MERNSKLGITSPYMTMAEAAIYLRYSGSRSAETAIRFLRTNGASLQRRGRTYLVTAAEIDRVLNGEPSALEVEAHRLAALPGSRQRKDSRLTLFAGRRQ